MAPIRLLIIAIGFLFLMHGIRDCSFALAQGKITNAQFSSPLILLKFNKQHVLQIELMFSFFLYFFPSFFFR